MLIKYDLEMWWLRQLTIFKNCISIPRKLVLYKYQKSYDEYNNEVYPYDSHPCIRASNAA